MLMPEFMKEKQDPLNSTDDYTIELSLDELQELVEYVLTQSTEVDLVEKILLLPEPNSSDITIHILKQSLSLDTLDKLSPYSTKNGRINTALFLTDLRKLLNVGDTSTTASIDVTVSTHSVKIQL